MTGGGAQNDPGERLRMTWERHGSASVECGSERLNGYLSWNP